MPVELKLVAEYSEVTKGVEAVNDGLDSVKVKTTEVNDSLKEVGKTGVDGLTKIENEAQKSVTALEAARKRIVDINAALKANKGDAGLVTALNKELEVAKKLFTEAGGKLEEFAEKGKKGGEKAGAAFKTLTEQIRAALKEAARAEIVYGANSKEALKAAQAVAELKDRQEELNAKVEALDPNKKFNVFSQIIRGVAGGFTAAIGAAALFGEKNEAVERTLVKIQAAMAFSQGINELLELGKGFNALKATLGITTAAIEVNTVAKTENTVAGAENVAVTAVETTAAKGLTVATNIQTIATNALTIATRLLLGPIGLILAGVAAVILLVKAFSDEGENYVETMDSMRVATENFAKSTDKLLFANENARKNAQNNFDILKAAGDKTIAQMKAQGKSEEEVAKEREKIDRDLLRAKVAIARQINDQADTEIANNNRRIAELRNFINSNLAAIRSGNLSDEERTKALELSEAAKKELESLDKLNKEKIQLQNDTDAKLEIDQQNFETNKAEVQSTANKAEIDRIKKQNDEVVKARAELKALLKSIDDKSGAAFGSLLTDPQDKLNFQQQQQNQEIEALRNSLIAKRIAAGESGTLTVEQEKQFALMRLAVQKQYNDASEKLALEDVKSKNDAVGDRLQFEEETAIAIVEARQRGAETEKQFETQKQLDILNIQLEFARKRLAIAITVAQATGDNSPEMTAIIAKMQAAVAKLSTEAKKAQAELEKSVPKFSIFRVLGLSGSDQDEQEFNDKAAELIAKGVDMARTALDAELEMNQERIDSNRQVVDSITNRIAEVQRGLELEIQLNREGLANNVDAKRKELAELEKQRRDALANEKKLAEEQKRIKREQQIVEAASQASSLLSAGATLFAQGAFSGPVGIITAIGTIVGMIASFLSLKGRVSEITKLGKGERLRGRKHTQGGMRIEGTNIEVEGDEWFINSASSEKYNELLHAINKDDFRKLKRKHLLPLLEGTGVVFHDDLGSRAAETSASYNSVVNEYHSMSGSAVATDIRSVLKEVSDWRREEKNKVVIHTLPNGDIMEIRKGGNDVKIISK